MAGKLDDKQVPCVFFFVRHFNDVDHLTPVAYKLCESKRGRPVVVISEPLDELQGDYRLRYLQDEFGVAVMSMFLLHPIAPFIGWLAAGLRLKIWRRFLHRERQYCLRALRRVFYGKSWAEKVLDRYQPAVLVFEWGRLSGAFGEVASSRGIPTISLPHGMTIWTNELVNRREQQAAQLDDRDYVNRFDRVVYQSRLAASRSVKEGVRAEKIAVLGSARYCEEWQGINLDIQPGRFTPAKGQGCSLKLVFMLPQWNYNSDLNDTMRSLIRLSEEPWLHLVLKPHTRETEAVPSYLRNIEKLPNVEVVGAVGSVALVQWADAVIVVGSSISLEALLQGKPHLDPKYLVENTTIFQETGAEWTVSNDEELVEALKSLEQGHPPPYGEEQVSNVVSQLVLGSSTERDVLKVYVDFILGGWRDHPTYEESLASRVISIPSTATLD